MEPSSPLKAAPTTTTIMMSPAGLKGAQLLTGALARTPTQGVKAATPALTPGRSFAISGLLSLNDAADVSPQTLPTTSPASAVRADVFSPASAACGTPSSVQLQSPTTPFAFAAADSKAPARGSGVPLGCSPLTTTPTPDVMPLAFSMAAAASFRPAPGILGGAPGASPPASRGGVPSVPVPTAAAPPLTTTTTPRAHTRVPKNNSPAVFTVMVPGATPPTATANPAGTPTAAPAAKAQPRRRARGRPVAAGTKRIGRKTDFVARKLPNTRNKRGVTSARRMVNRAAGIPPTKRWRHGIGSRDTAINGDDARKILEVFEKYFPSYMTGDALHTRPIPEEVAIARLTKLFDNGEEFA